MRLTAVEGPVARIVSHKAEDHPVILRDHNSVAPMGMFNVPHELPKLKLASQHRCGVIRRLALPPTLATVHDPELSRELKAGLQRECSTHLVSMHMKRVVAVVQVVDDHVYDPQVVDGCHQLRATEIV